MVLPLRIFDENKYLNVSLYRPQDERSCYWTVRPIAKNYAIWLTPGDPEPRDVRPSGWPTKAAAITNFDWAPRPGWLGELPASAPRAR
jgi:hypothetical protein